MLNNENIDGVRRQWVGLAGRQLLLGSVGGLSYHIIRHLEPENIHPQVLRHVAQTLWGRLCEAGAIPLYDKKAFASYLESMLPLSSSIIKQLEEAVTASGDTVDFQSLYTSLTKLAQHLAVSIQFGSEAITSLEVALNRIDSWEFADVATPPISIIVARMLFYMSFMLGSVAGLYWMLFSSEAPLFPYYRKMMTEGSYLHQLFELGWRPSQRILSYFGPWLNLNALVALDARLNRDEDQLQLNLDERTLCDRMSDHLVAVTGMSEEDLRSCSSFTASLFPLAHRNQYWDIARRDSWQNFANSQSLRAIDDTPFVLPLTLLQLIMGYLERTRDRDTAQMIRIALQNRPQSRRGENRGLERVRNVFEAALPGAVVALFAYLFQKVKHIAANGDPLYLSKEFFNRCLQSYFTLSTSYVPRALLMATSASINDTLIAANPASYYQAALSLRGLSAAVVNDTSSQQVVSLWNFHSCVSYGVEIPRYQLNLMQRLIPALDMGMTIALFVLLAFQLWNQLKHYYSVWRHPQRVPQINDFRYLTSPSLNAIEQQAAREVITQFQSLSPPKKQQLRGCLVELLGGAELFVGGIERVVDTLFTGLESLAIPALFVPKVVFINERCDASYIVVTEDQEGQLLNELIRRYRKQDICIKPDREMQSLVIHQVRTVFQGNVAAPFFNMQEADNRVPAIDPSPH